MDLRRTDLAMEARELWQERAGQTAQLPGVRAEERKRAGMPVTVVQVLDERGEQALGKPRGTYITLTLEGVETRADGAFPRAVEAVAAELGALLEEAREVFAAAALSLYGQPCPPQRRELAAQVTENLTKAQIMRTIELFQSYRRECDWNVGPGHVLGALAAELEGIL